MSLEPGALPHEPATPASEPWVALGHTDVLAHDGTRPRAWSNDRVG